jgi:predicted SAM-dependent methyltransferase
MIEISHINGPIRLFLSAGPYIRDNFIATQQEQLDLLKREDWEQSFGERKVSVILAEHVWEHLTIEEGKVAAKTCFDYLEVGGFVRCGVPDAYFPDEAYQRLVAINGPGPAADHKVVYNYRTLRDVFESAGFEVRLLEWWDEQGQFHWEDWNADEGLIYRSRRFDPRNQDGKLGFTSLIVDAVKPGTVIQESASCFQWSSQQMDRKREGATLRPKPIQTLTVLPVFAAS